MNSSQIPFIFAPLNKLYVGDDRNEWHVMCKKCKYLLIPSNMRNAYCRIHQIVTHTAC